MRRERYKWRVDDRLSWELCQESQGRVHRVGGGEGDVK